MLKGTESGLLIQIKDIEHDIKELELKLRSKMFITRIDFFIYPKDKMHFERLETLLKKFGFKLFIAEEKAHRTTIRMKSKESEMVCETLAVEEKAQTEAIASTSIMSENNQLPSENNEGNDLISYISNLETLMVHRTLRSGQKIDHHGNVIIMGDVNAGSEVFAQGDVIVFGKIKGSVHAGRMNDEKATITALAIETARVLIGQKHISGEIPKNQMGHYQKAFISPEGTLVIEAIKI